MTQRLAAFAALGRHGCARRAWLRHGWRARAAESLPVPTVTIYPGDVIADGDARRSRLPAADTVARSAILDAREALVGKVARRTLLPGQPIPINAIRDP